LANVVIRVVSRPASGSVTPKQTCRSPLTIRGRFCFFMSSEPCTITGCIPKIDRCIELAPFMPAPDADTSSSSRAASEMPNPCPPYSSGVVMPSQPPSANAL
jgi:hypothetical protein